jgi:hypothetical protein
MKKVEKLWYNVMPFYHQCPPKEAYSDDYLQWQWKWLHVECDICENYMYIFGKNIIYLHSLWNRTEKLAKDTLLPWINQNPV